MRSLIWLLSLLMLSIFSRVESFSLAELHSRAGSLALHGYFSTLRLSSFRNDVLKEFSF